MQILLASNCLGGASRVTPCYVLRNAHLAQKQYQPIVLECRPAPVRLRTAGL